MLTLTESMLKVTDNYMFLLNSIYSPLVFTRPQQINFKKHILMEAVKFDAFFFIALERHKGEH